MTPQDGAQTPTLDQVPPVMRAPEPTVIQGLDRLTANPDAIGAAPDPVADPNANAADPNASQVTDGQQTATPVQTAKPIEERVKEDPELAKFLEAERSRAVNGYIQKRDAEVIRQKLQADAVQREQAMQELARKAELGDEEAIRELGKTAAAQVLQKLTLTEYARQWITEAEAGLKKVFSDDPTVIEQLHPGMHGTIPDWLQAVTDAKLAKVKSEFEASKQQEVERLAEAKAADLVRAARGHLPIPDLTAPVSGGGAPRQWKTLSEASILLNEDKISMDEYALAKQWYEEGRIPFGQLG